MIENEQKLIGNCGKYGKKGRKSRQEHRPKRAILPQLMIYDLPWRKKQI